MGSRNARVRSLMSGDWFAVSFFVPALEVRDRRCLKAGKSRASTLVGSRDA